MIERFGIFLELIKGVSNFLWMPLTGLSVDDCVSLVSKYILNIFSNFVPHKTITIRDKDALWMTPEIKQLLLDKAKIYRRWRKRENPLDGQALTDITYRCRLEIKSAKENHLTRLGTTMPV